MADVLLRFFHAYKDPNTFETVEDIRQIAKYYLKTWFVIDILAVFPF
jgi:hypothetical protein